MKAPIPQPHNISQLNVSLFLPLSQEQSLFMQHVFPFELSKHSFQKRLTVQFEELLERHSPGHSVVARKKLIEHPVIRWKLAEMTRQAQSVQSLTSESEQKKSVGNQCGTIRKEHFEST